MLAARLAVLVAGVGLWELVAGRLISTFYLPEPTQVVVQLGTWVTDGSLLTNLLATIVPAAEGFAIALVCALVLGYILASARTAGKVLEPYITAAYSIPTIAIVPVLIVWFGTGQPLVIAVSAIASFFTLFYNVYFGIRDVNQSLVEQIMIAGGSKWDVIIRVRLQSALVWLVAALKLAVPHALLGVVIAEFLVGGRGLGYLLSFNAGIFNAPGTFAAVIVLAAVVFVLDRLVFLSTRRALMWKQVN